MLSFLCILSFSINIEIFAKSYCLATDSSKCPRERDFYNSETTTTLANWAVTSADILIIDSPKNHISINSKIGPVKIAGNSNGLSINVSIPQWTTKLTLENIEIATNAKSMFALETILNGDVNFKDFRFKTALLRVGETISKLTHNISVYMMWSAALPAKGYTKANAYIDSDGIDRILQVANNKIIVGSANNLNKLSIKSAIPKMLDITFNQLSGKLDVKRYGSPELDRMLKLIFNAQGGSINFADQTWRRITNGINFNELIFGNRLMELNHLKSTKIHIAGREIPVSIINKGTDALKVIVDQVYAGIQGKLDLPNKDDAIEILKNISKSPIEFVIGKLVTNNKLDLSDNVGISMDSEFFEGISGIFTKIFKGIAATIEGKVMEVLSIATGGKIDTRLTTNGEIKVGRIDVTKQFKMSKIRDTKFNIISDISEISNFQDVKKLISNPITVFCSATEFECDKFDLNMIPGVENLPMPKPNFTCFKNSKKQQCVNVTLPKLPEWMPEKYCFAKSKEQCPAGTFPVSPDNAGEVINHVHDLTKKVLVTFGMGDAASALDFANFIGKDLIFDGSGSQQRPKVNVKGSLKFGNVYNGSVSFNGVELDSDSGNFDALRLFAPILDFKNTSLAKAFDKTAVDFSKNIVNMDVKSFGGFVNSIFGTLNLAVNDIVSAIEVTPKEFEIKGNQVAQNIKTELIQSAFNAEIEIPSTGLTLKFSGNGTKGIGLNIAQSKTVGNISFQYEVGVGYDWGNGVVINSTGALNLNNLPNGINISLQGSGDVTINPETGMTQLNLEGSTEITGAGKKIVLNVNSQVDVNIKNLTVLNAGGSVNGKISVTNPLNQEMELNIVEFNVDANCKPVLKEAAVSGNVTLLPGSGITIDTLKFSHNIPMSFRRGPLSEATEQVLEIRYKFKEGGFPVIDANNISETPDRILLVYDETEEEFKDLLVNEWIDTPQTIVYAKFSVDECNKWKDRLEFGSMTPGVKNVTFDAICDEDQDPNAFSESDEETKVALMVSLKSVELADGSILEDEEISVINKSKVGKIVGGVIGVLALVAVVCVGSFFGWKYYKNKKNDINAEERNELTNQIQV
ncbi:hypothetical protein TVAG_218130 [Trichomonas vaginalis G3]|uniref:Surface antigen BspA-like n=1 Tax=Trichomonas vaginalis (strain ATCC PRA-98 / G3) TaxID=412133 RepID=A2FD06_TRIV3|nr:hypothetical protein TVAGG3_0422850 [Trichomonas vaginalis G3]EAX97199.1 hypothetical protein TVAG_218130 [Trichomonas vaginalis G3]KAI5536188.1 hypothetical protein TVAGG3_0422850 [Trichomonas vaginalis G3]|eukprot:XP_001310129.1 hypothetical protein [Trichomonas vaginalis G3]